ncbi:ATP-binding protein [Planococcus koreensis]|uniref:ATP-binding protein n=1 Tax=Planococcus koreensis TaxID=112331 RepID=UPI0039FDD5E4
MERIATNRYRNRLFIHLFGLAHLIHTFIHYVTGETLPYYSIAFGILSYILLVVLYRMKINERALEITILLLMNLSVFILNFETVAAVNIVYFAIPIVASALYYDTLPIIGLGILSAIEILLLAFVFDQLGGRAPMFYVNLTLFVFIFFVLAMTVLHSVFFRKVWTQIEKKNESMERALLSKEGYLHLFFETAKDAIAVFDVDNKIIAINPAFEELYGWTQEECLGRSLPLVPEDRYDEVAERTLRVQQGESFSLLETQDLKKDGSRFDVQITLSPITDEVGNVIATSIISRDISYKKDAEKLILQAEKLKLTGEIAAGVAHEIRNPMTVISGFVQMMDNDEDYPYKEYTKLIHSEIERINLIISEFLVLAKPQPSYVRKISLKKVMGDIIMLFGPEMNMRGITFSSCWEQEDYFINGEEHQMKQVFINLIKNAIEAIDGLDRTGIIELRVEGHTDSHVSMRLHDNGAGISPETLAMIFEPFYTTKATGTGLGLLISQKIVQEHNGTLTIESREGTGTIATALLPCI